MKVVLFSDINVLVTVSIPCNSSKPVYTEAFPGGTAGYYHVTHSVETHCKHSERFAGASQTHDNVRLANVNWGVRFITSLYPIVV